MSKALKILLPFVLLAVGALGAVAMYLSKPEAETRRPEAPVPLVRVQEIRLEDRQLVVRSQGTVRPRTESVLVPEVAGRLVEVSPSFVSGGFFEKGDLLLRVDPGDYQEAVVRARALVAQAELRLAQEHAEKDLAVREWQELGEGDPTPLTLRVPQVAEAQAAVESAKASLRAAERDLERTTIRAPYAGRVRSKSADVGQYVAPGTPLGTVYAVDFAEIRLPLPDRDLAFLDLPLVYREEADSGPGARVVLKAEFAGRHFEWEGRIVRTEGEIDPRSRMVNAVAQVKDPYSRAANPDRPPLAAGLFVEAEILGNMVSNVAVVPRAALRDDGRLLVVDADDRLRLREVDILRRTEREVIVRSGLADGERVCLTPLVAVTDGMRVRTGDS